MAQDAGILTRYLTFDGSCTQVWERVLREAHRRGKLLDLVRVAEHEYAESGKVKVTRVILESGGVLREMPAEEEGPVANERRSGDSYTDMMLDAIGALRADVRDLRKDGDERGDKLAKQVSDLRHETRGELASLRPMVQAHQKLLEAQATQMKVVEKRITALEERPETHANRVIILVALATGIVAAVGGELIASLVAAVMAKWVG